MTEWQFELRHKHRGGVVDRAMALDTLVGYGLRAVHLRGFTKHHTFVAVHVPSGRVVATLQRGCWEFHDQEGVAV